MLVWFSLNPYYRPIVGYHDQYYGYDDLDKEITIYRDGGRLEKPHNKFVCDFSYNLHQQEVRINLLGRVSTSEGRKSHGRMKRKREAHFKQRGGLWESF